MFALHRQQHDWSTPRGTPWNLGPKWPTPCWASETFDRKLRPNGYIAQRSQWTAYKKPPSLFRMVLSLTPYDLPFPQNGVSYVPRYANGHIPATGDPIHFMFCSRVGFWETADRMALFPVRTNPRWRPPPCWKNFKWPYLHNRSSDPLHMFGYRVGFSGTADLMALFSNRTNSRWRPPPSWLISNGHILRNGSRYTYSAHRAVIFAIAQVSCWQMYS